jgi:hypothetical protein
MFQSVGHGRRWGAGALLARRISARFGQVRTIWLSLVATRPLPVALAGHAG